MQESKGIEAKLERINDNIVSGTAVVAMAISLAGGAIGSGLAAGLCFVLAVLLLFFLLKSASDEKEPVESKNPTRYRHYKGGTYELVCEATIEADHTPIIVYRAADGSIWSRPKAVFFEQIEVDGKSVQRFVEI